MEIPELKSADSLRSGMFNVSVAKRFILLFCLWLLCSIIMSVVSGILMHGAVTAVKLRIALVVQDLLVFIIPALITAVIVSRRPADLLMICNVKRPEIYLFTVMAILVMIPAMNRVISWNESLQLPESMSSLQHLLEQAEKSAQSSMALITDDTSVGGLILGLLIIGVCAGFSEELFFRGGLQQLMIKSNVPHHLAIWLTAIIFSAMHFQFFGFVPRMLLGAAFGYLAFWTGSIWVPALAHTVNNSLALIAMWLRNRSAGSAMDIDKVGVSDSVAADLPIIVASVILTLAILLWIKRLSADNTKPDNRSVQ